MRKTAARPASPAPAADITHERILDSCEALIRRHGPAKATVVDVARVLGRSHASLYRYFPSKAALREAVLERWLLSIEAELDVVANGPGDAAERIERWLYTLAAIKRKRLLHDPELFEAYALLGDDAAGAVAKHLAIMTAQLGAIIEEGIGAGEFAVRSPAAAAQAVLDASSAFHNPRRVPETVADPGGEARLDAVVELISAGLRTAPAAGRGEGPPLQG